jgi:hypothetical protein
MKTSKTYQNKPSHSSWAGSLLLGVVLASPFSVNAIYPLGPSVTLQYLLDGGTIDSGDKHFFNFHDFTQAGDLFVPATQIFVFPIINGPGLSEEEYGIRFQSSRWLLNGVNQTYDLALDFNVSITEPAFRFSDNTLEVTGGIAGDASILIAEGVIDELTGDSLANKLVFILNSGVKLQDHQEFTHTALELEISKDLAMFTGPLGGIAFVSHFDQSFSQTVSPVPEPGTWAAGFAMTALVGGQIWRRRQQGAK